MAHCLLYWTFCLSIVLLELLQYLGEIEDHLGVTIDQIAEDIKVPINEFDGKVVYGQKLKSKGELKLVWFCPGKQLPPERLEKKNNPYLTKPYLAQRVFLYGEMLVHFAEIENLKELKHSSLLNRRRLRFSVLLEDSIWHVLSSPRSQITMILIGFGLLPSDRFRIQGACRNVGASGERVGRTGETCSVIVH